MIRELSELGKTLRKEQDGNEWVHNALKPESISMEILIDHKGNFQQFNIINDKLTPAEAITAKKGKARLLLDKPEEILCFGGDASKKKHQLFLNKLAEYKELTELSPVFAFYKENKDNGLDKALKEYITKVETTDKKEKKALTGNIGFRINTEALRIHEKPEVLRTVIAKFESLQKEQLLISSYYCSVCGKNEYPVEDLPHGMIKKVPNGQTSGCALISYNENAFESYGFEGNKNSSVCTNCARTYVEGLNWLLSSGHQIVTKNKKGKEQELFRYTNPKISAFIAHLHQMRKIEFPCRFFDNSTF